MKKVFEICLVLAILFHSLPVMAASGPQLTVTIEAPNEVYIGDSMPVSVFAGTAKNMKMTLLIDFPKFSVASVRLVSGDLTMEDLPDYHRFVWNGKVKSETLEAKFEVTMGMLGTMPIVVVSDPEYVLAGDFVYVMSQP